MLQVGLKLARNLLTDDGFVALAMDDSEIENLIKLCDEIFGEENKIGIVTIVHKPEGRNQEKFFGTSNEFALFYAKNKQNAKFNNVILDSEKLSDYQFVDSNGKYKKKDFIRRADGKYATREAKPKFWYPIYVSKDLSNISLNKNEEYYEIYPVIDNGVERTWKTLPETFMELYKKGDIIADIIGEKVVISEKMRENQVIKTHWIKKEYHAYHFGTKILDELLKDKTFDFPKSLFLMIDILKLITKENDIILDFFSGSATTAHAVMQLNSEDQGNRKYIMVQLPEATDEKSEAYKAGYKNICEIGKERIRRAAASITNSQSSITNSQSSITNDELRMKSGELFDNEEFVIRNSQIRNSDVIRNSQIPNSDVIRNSQIPNSEEIRNLDIGFRVYRLDSTNMQDVYYRPQDYQQENLQLFADNVKPDRSAEDLVAQIMLDWGLELSLPIERKTIANKEVFAVAENSLYCCFDVDIDENFAKEVAKEKPLRIVFKDSGFKNDTAKENVKQLLKQLSGETEMRVI